MKKGPTAHFVKGIRGTDEILQDGTPQIAFIGRSNVGKSSVINALTGVKSLAKVGKKPGKTTEINFFLFRKKFYIVDLPGYGYAQATPKEREKLKNLIVWYFSASDAKPHTVVLVLDAVAGLTPFDEDMIGILRNEEHPFVIVVNKIDKLKQDELLKAVAGIKENAGDAEILQCSVKTGRGVEALSARLFGNTR
ncbi:MAG: GTP-binding protein [Parcubacteria group bacterium Athens0416_74]|nr:MAG: GTP-binding protein [Parcubacteria group bacterium Athens0416_74]